MTELLDRAIETVRTLPPEMQDDVARTLLRWAGSEGSALQLSPEEKADLLLAEAEIERGEVASEPELQAFWSKSLR